LYDTFGFPSWAALILREKVRVRRSWFYDCNAEQKIVPTASSFYRDWSVLIQNVRGNIRGFDQQKVKLHAFVKVDEKMEYYTKLFWIAILSEVVDKWVDKGTLVFG
jgi:hypothetical protein